MKRIIAQELINWKDSAVRKPLIVRGARQVGKTWSIEDFGNRHFDGVVKVDFEKRPDLCSIFEGDLDSRRIIENLEVVTGKKISPEHTLLFLDEIQACPRAIMGLRYFYEEMPGLHVIAAGSLLEFSLGEISVPVGRVQYLNMYPMNFYEFLCAIGSEQAADRITKKNTETPDAIHTQLTGQLQKYFFVGGMPECVYAYGKSGSVLDAFKVQSQLIDSFKEDFSKYAGRSNKDCLSSVLLSVAQQIGDQIKYTSLSNNFSGPTNQKAFDLLVLARIIHKVPSCRQPSLPLGAVANQKKFKAILLDIGLMQRLCNVPVDKEILCSDLLDMYRGRLAEQFIAQELLVKYNSELYYWAREERGSSAEVDFTIVEQGNIYPIEVKSGKGGSLRSLHLMLSKYPNCKNGLVYYSGQYKELPEQKITFLPLYYVTTAGKV